MRYEFRTCANCIHKEVCKILYGEMYRRNYQGRDFGLELISLQTELGGRCLDYKKGEVPLG